MKFTFFTSFVLAATTLNTVLVAAAPAAVPPKFGDLYKCRYTPYYPSDDYGFKSDWKKYHGGSATSGKSGDVNGGDVNNVATDGSTIVNGGSNIAGNGGFSASGDASSTSGGDARTGDAGDANGGSVNNIANGWSTIINKGSNVAGNGGNSISGDAKARRTWTEPNTNSTAQSGDSGNASGGDVTNQASDGSVIENHGTNRAGDGGNSVTGDAKATGYNDKVYPWSGWDTCRYYYGLGEDSARTGNAGDASGGKVTNTASGQSIIFNSGDNIAGNGGNSVSGDATTH